SILIDTHEVLIIDVFIIGRNHHVRGYLSHALADGSRSKTVSRVRARWAWRCGFDARRMAHRRLCATSRATRTHDLGDPGEYCTELVRSGRHACYCDAVHIPLRAPRRLDQTHAWSGHGTELGLN